MTVARVKTKDHYTFLYKQVLKIEINSVHARLNIWYGKLKFFLLRLKQLRMLLSTSLCHGLNDTLFLECIRTIQSWQFFYVSNSVEKSISSIILPVAV